MSELVLAAGSFAGIFTALALERASSSSSHLNPMSRRYYDDGGDDNNDGEGSVGNNYEAPELERRMVHQAINRVYDYERAGRITSVERERLLAKYRARLEDMNSATGSSGPGLGSTDTHLFSRNLIALLDQRFAQISAKIEDLRSSMESAPAQVQDSSGAESEKKEPVVDNKEMKSEKAREGDKKETQVSQSRTESPPAVDSMESSENDGSLEEIKKQIMQTLSRLEQAEVE